MLLFTIIVSSVLAYNLVQQTNSIITTFEQEFPEFRVENNLLVLETENQFIKGDENGYFGIIMNNQIENLDTIKDDIIYQNTVALLKDKVIIKMTNNTEVKMTYEELKNSGYDSNMLSKQEILNFAKSKQMTTVYITSILVLATMIFIMVTTQVIFDIFMLSILAYLLSRVTGIKFKYKEIFNMSVYAITLSVILMAIYVCANALIGFNIEYFQIAYDSISYIYIVTAILIIKSEIIKQQIEVQKIVNEQKKISEEIKKEKEEKPEENKEDKKEEKENDKDKKEKPEENPQGSEA